MRAVLNMLGFTMGGGLSVGLNVLARLEEVAPDDRFLVLVPDVDAYDRVVMPVNAVKRVFRVSSAKHLKRLWIDHVAIPSLCREFEADVLFSMSNFGPYRAPCAHMLGVHLAQLAYPTWPSWEKLAAHERIFLRAQGIYLAVSIAHVDRVCALTRTAADRMIQTFALGPERVVVVPNAAPPDSYFELPDVPPIREAMTTNPARIRLCYPALGYSHKNHEVLPETFRILRESHGIDDVALFVTVDASDSPNAGPFLSAIHALGLQERIVNLGRLDPSAIPTVFRNAHGLLMPTLLESFSLSYLEAMRFGVPILTSDYDFAREVCGDAALYFDPLDPGAVASAIARFTRHPEVERELRARTVERDRERDDSWADVTRKYVAILRSVCAGDRTRGTATASV